MDEIKKLLKKISKKDRDRLLVAIRLLVSGSKKISIQKIRGSDLHRMRCGRYRIIFHYEQKEIIIDSIKLRNEKTYKKK